MNIEGSIFVEHNGTIKVRLSNLKTPKKIQELQQQFFFFGQIEQSGILQIAIKNLLIYFSTQLGDLLVDVISQLKISQSIGVTDPFDISGLCLRPFLRITSVY